MTDQDDVFDDDEIPSQEDLALEATLREAEQALRELEERGWVWRGNNDSNKLLCHPDDAEINIWFNPFSGEQLLSPKLVERIKQDHQRERGEQ